VTFLTFSKLMFSYQPGVTRGH